MNKVIGLTLALALPWLSTFDAVFAEEMSAEQYARSAVESVREGNRAEALADFNKAVELAPQQAINFRNRAAFFSLTKQWDQAITDYDAALSLESNDPATVFDRGYAYLQLGKLDQALTDFDSTLDAQPDHERALRYRAYIYTDAKTVCQGRRRFNQADRKKSWRSSKLQGSRCCHGGSGEMERRYRG